MQREFESRRIDRRQSVVHRTGKPAIALADKAQSQMLLLARLPARTGNAGLQTGKRLRNIIGKRECHEEPHASRLCRKAAEREPPAKSENDGEIADCAE